MPPVPQYRQRCRRRAAVRVQVQLLAVPALLCVGMLTVVFAATSSSDSHVRGDRRPGAAPANEVATAAVLLLASQEQQASAGAAAPAARDLSAAAAQPLDEGVARNATAAVTATPTAAATVSPSAWPTMTAAATPSPAAASSSVVRAAPTAAAEAGVSPAPLAPAPEPAVDAAPSAPPTAAPPRLLVPSLADAMRLYVYRQNIEGPGLPPFSSARFNTYSAELAHAASTMGLGCIMGPEVETAEPPVGAVGTEDAATPLVMLPRACSPVWTSVLAAGAGANAGLVLPPPPSRDALLSEAGLSVMAIAAMRERLAHVAARLGRPLRAVLLDGSAYAWRMDGSKPPFGDIGQWTDFAAALMAMGVDVHFVWRNVGLPAAIFAGWEAAGQEVASAPRETNEGELFFVGPRMPDLVFTDYVGYDAFLRGAGLQPRLVAAIRRRLYLLDLFGTAGVNNWRPVKEAEKDGVSGMYCCKRIGIFRPGAPLDPEEGSHRILTLYPAGANAYLGAIDVDPPAARARAFARLQAAGMDAAAAAPPRGRVAIIYGKEPRFLSAVPGTLDVLRAFHDEGYTLYATFPTTNLPGAAALANTLPFVQNLGVLSQHDLFERLETARVMIGLGKPYIGQGAIEGLKRGMTIIQPAFNPHRDCRNDDELRGKPICTAYTSQNPFLERSFNDPARVWTTDYGNASNLHAVRSWAAEVAARPDSAFQPTLVPEFTPAAFLLRVAGILARAVEEHVLQ